MRNAKGLSLDALAAATGVSRATLARIESGQVSPTAQALNAVAGAYDVALSQLLTGLEGPAEAKIAAAEQSIWVDPRSGFERRNLSPPAEGFTAEMIEGRLPAGAAVAYDRPPKDGLEHHLYLLAGALRVDIEGAEYRLNAGDALRWRLYGPSRFESVGSEDARYVLALV